MNDQVGFLKTNNRINVACSRARDGFYIIGNSALMSTVDMWQNIIKNLANKSRLGTGFQTCCSRHPKDIHTVQEPKDFKRIPICQVPCNMKLTCGHICKEKCHDPTLHDRMACQEPCQQTLGCGHLCKKSCGQPCGQCSADPTEKKLSCGHMHSSTCGDNEEGKKIVCNMVVGLTTLSCGHKIKQLCSTKDQPPPACKVSCGITLGCGHLCSRACLDCIAVPARHQCSGPCGKKQKCGHACTAPCHQGECSPCQQPCQKGCEHGNCSRPCSLICDPCVRVYDRKCEHQDGFPTMCNLPCGVIPCSKPCSCTLACGHLCPSLCGEICATVCIQCKTGVFPEKPKMVLSCGHVFDVDQMDMHVGLKNIYHYDSNGNIERPQLISSKLQDLNINASCPDCGKSCANIRRYAFIDQLQKMPDVIDRLYAKMGRKMEMYIDGINRVKEELRSSTETFKENLKPSPLSGKTNEQLVKDRGNKIMDVQQTIVKFKGMYTYKAGMKALIRSR